MKIGILTFHFARNYGAVLQCFALQEFLRSRGHEVKIIDYRPSSVADGYKLVDIRRFWGRTPSKFISKTRIEMKALPHRKARYSQFDRFISKNMVLGGMDEHYDLRIIGSDQVWNTAITKGFDCVYWGERFKGCISYAASGSGSLLKESPEEIGRRLDNFEGISIRESSTAYLLQAWYRKKQIHCCCDPVFLQKASFWNDIAATSGLRLTPGSYILLYQTRYSEIAEKEAQKISVEKNLRVITLSAKVERDNSPEVIDASPEAFLALVSGAAQIVTTSFHCTAFAKIWGIACHNIKMGDGSDDRIDDLNGTDEEGICESIKYLESFGI